VRKLGTTLWAMSAVVLGMSGSLYALDVADVVREWTPEGKKLAMERAKLPAHDEMIRIPAGEFLMGSDRKVDKNSYLAEFPQRKIYLDAYEIDKYEVTTVQFLKFVLASNLRLPSSIGSMTAGIFKRRWSVTRSCTCPGSTQRRTASGRGNGCRPKRNGKRPRAVRTGASTHGAIRWPDSPGRTLAVRACQDRCETVPSGCTALSADHFCRQVRQCRQPLWRVSDGGKCGRVGRRLVRPEILRHRTG
jgi:hypothetical protein